MAQATKSTCLRLFPVLLLMVCMTFIIPKWRLYHQVWIKDLGAILTLREHDRQSQTWMQLWFNSNSSHLCHGTSLLSCRGLSSAFPAVLTGSPSALSSCSDFPLPSDLFLTPVPISPFLGPFSLTSECPTTGTCPTLAIFPLLIQPVMCLCNQSEPWEILNSKSHWFFSPGACESCSWCSVCWPLLEIQLTRFSMWWSDCQLQSL